LYHGWYLWRLLVVLSGKVVLLWGHTSNEVLASQTAAQLTAFREEERQKEREAKEHAASYRHAGDKGVASQNRGTYDVVA
jgi:hypothetical protein